MRRRALMKALSILFRTLDIKLFSDFTRPIKLRQHNPVISLLLTYKAAKSSWKSCCKRSNCYQQLHFVYYLYDDIWRKSDVLKFLNLWIFLLMKVMMTGSFSIDDGDGSENVTFRMNSRFVNFVAFIPICRKCLMQVNFPGVDNLGTALKFRKRVKSSSWLVYAIHKKVKLSIFTS